MELHLKEENSILGDGQFRLRCVAWAFLCRKKSMMQCTVSQNAVCIFLT